MGRYVLEFQEIDRTQTAAVGGKGALLGELSQLEGVSVPPGFCVTIEAFRLVVAQDPSLDHRQAIRTLPIPHEVASAIADSLARLGGDDTAYAVRSSATTEDSPAASFAGQHDSYLNVTGREAILERIRDCWASLFTERAVAYRLRHGHADLQRVEMAVVVQQMAFPQAAGVLFTADPVTSNRKVASVEATLGLGDALVSGNANADGYQVSDGRIVSRTLATGQPALTDEQAIRLAQLGRRIEAHLGRPQDIEWCLVDDAFQIVQSRPITTLFPIPQAPDEDDHVYVSVGHQQMMTDAMKPLGLSVWQTTALVPMHEAGGRLFVEVTQRLAAPATRSALLGALTRSDPLIGDALQTILDRGDLVLSPPAETPRAIPGTGPPAEIETDPAIVAELIERSENAIAALNRAIATKSGAELIDFILDDIQQLRRELVEPRNHQAIMAGMEASWWLNDHLEEWLGEVNAADTLTQSAPHNVTSEMGLALLDVADAIRPHPSVVAFLKTVDSDADGDDFLDHLATLEGGPQARDAFCAYLDSYGMRCVGEIDITRPRWSERPAALLPAILGNVENFQPGAAKRHFEQGRQEAQAKEQELLKRLRALPEGERKAQEAKRMIDRVRTFIGYREYPKYGIVSRYFAYKQALLREAKRLVRSGVLEEEEEIFYVRLEELAAVAETNRADRRLIRERRESSRFHQTLTPPRVLTSDGEVVAGSYRREDVPAGALVGLAVSSGTVEGRARVILDMARADLKPGDILVTTCTDPSWTPLFVAVEALVTEVGGLMTHGAVIAREYGLPAVVGVQHATQAIADGQRIRVDGTRGYVEILS